VVRDLLISGVGAALAWVVWQRLPAQQLERRLAGRADRTAVALALAAGLVGVSLLGLRYATWHTHLFDLGSYDQKIWVASVQDDLTGVLEQTYRGGERFSPCGTTRYWGICHFQPLYVIYALAYRLWPSPLLLLWSQALLVASGGIPCYLLFRDRLGSTAGVMTVMCYLLYPAVQFNALLDFRPDHVAIPFLFWAFWLAERNRPGLSLVAAAIPALAKESLILAFAAFGLYLLARRRHVLLGAAATTVGIAIFIVVVFGVAAPGNSEGAFMIRRYLSVGSELVAPGLVTRKLFYLVSLFGPVAFLSWRDPVALLPAMPSLGISLLSNDTNHFSIESQYAASVVAPAFAGLLTALGSLEALRSGAALRALGALVTLSFVLSCAQGPTPLGLGFWNQHWGHKWHFRSYMPDRQTALDEAARLIPANPDVMIVSQNDVNTAALAHRHYFFPFPAGIDRADYVLVDTARRPFLYWIVPRDREPYDRIVRQLRGAPEYRVAFERDGVVLFQRTEPSRPGIPDPERLPIRPEGLPK
jgi:uncharacterized membrane protein